MTMRMTVHNFVIAIGKPGRRSDEHTWTATRCVSCDTMSARLPHTRGEPGGHGLPAH
jgi:hypothetical protein